MVKNIIIVILALTSIALIAVDHFQREEAKTEKQKLLDDIEVLELQNDSLAKQINAREKLIENLDQNAKKLTERNRRIRHEYNQRVKNLSRLNATQHVELFTENFGD